MKLLRWVTRSEYDRVTECWNRDIQRLVRMSRQINDASKSIAAANAHIERLSRELSEANAKYADELQKRLALADKVRELESKGGESNG